jgi:hypothetical protein
MKHTMPILIFLLLLINLVDLGASSTKFSSSAKDINQRQQLRGHGVLSSSAAEAEQKKKTMSIALVRVSARNAVNSHSKETLLDAWFGDDEHSFKSQMEQNRFDSSSPSTFRGSPPSLSSSSSIEMHLQIKQGAYIDLQLNQDIDSFVTSIAMKRAIEQELLKRTNVLSLRGIADKVIFCYPPGSPGNWLLTSAPLNCRWHG